MKPIVTALILILALACVQKPAPVSSESTTVAADEQPAIAVEYVGVPKMNVYAQPAADAEVVGSYGLKEAISVLEKKGEWTRVRTFNGSGWVRQADLMTAQTAEAVDTNIPRFYVQPVAVPFSTRGEIWLQCKVNTDGDVVEVNVTNNTTGSTALATANADSLKAAKFYPMIDKGTRKTFTYEHRVYY
jgi:hypothetical protein